RLFTIVTKRGVTARFVRTRIVPVLVPLVFRLPSFPSFLVRIASQIGVNYRQSPLSPGGAGAIQSGDRLPWVETAPGKDNFAPLASLRWQVHVYGELRDDMVEACAELGLPLHPFPG